MQNDADDTSLCVARRDAVEIEQNTFTMILDPQVIGLLAKAS